RVRNRMPSTPKREVRTGAAASSDAMDVLLGFGTLMMRAGNTATRTREWIEVIGRRTGFDAISVSLSLDSITASVRRSGERVTAMREIGLPGINGWRIAELEQLAKTAGTTPSEIAVRLEDIEAAKPLYSSMQISAAVGVASAAFAFLNGAAAARNDLSRDRRRDRPVVPGLAVPPLRQSIRYCHIVCHCRFGDICSDGGVGTTCRR